LACVARIGQALLLNFPLHLYEHIVGNRSEAFGRKCRLWMAVGYTRQCVFSLAPKWFGQSRFFERLEFRKERETFSRSSAAVGRGEAVQALRGLQPRADACMTRNTGERFGAAAMPPRTAFRRIVRPGLKAPVHVHESEQKRGKAQDVLTPEVDISVVVCTYNRAGMLRKALEGLTSQVGLGRLSYEIIVVDDASTDSTSTVVKKVAERSRVSIRYVREEGRGIARARNRGLRESFGNWVAFFDDDQLAEPQWLRELFACAADNGAHCVGGARFLRLPEEPLRKLSPQCRLILGEIDHGREPIRCSRKTRPCTGNVLIKRSVFDAVGNFDESMRWGGSDIDFFRRVSMQAFECWYSPRAVVHHITPSYRLTTGYLTWRSLLHGKNFANRDHG